MKRNFETENGEQRKKVSREIIDDLLDDLETQLKPLSKGLGFHQKPEAHFTVKDSMILKSTKDLSRKNPPKRSIEQDKNLRTEKSSEIQYIQNMLEISDKKRNEYEPPQTEFELEESGEEVIARSNPWTAIFLAEFVDFFILLISFSFLGYFTHKIALLNNVDLFRIVHTDDFIIYILGAFSFYYFLYKAIGHYKKNESIGYGVFGLETKSEKNEELSFFHTIFRSLLSIISSIVFFVPVGIGFVDKVLGIKVTTNE